MNTAQNSATMPTMPARQLLRYVRAAQRLGARLPQLVEAMGVSEADLRDPAAQVAGEVYDRLIAAVVRETGDPLCMLRLGEQTVPHTFSDMNFGALFLPTLGGALSSSVAVQINMNQRFKVAVDRGPKESAFALVETANDAEPPRDIILVALGLYNANIHATGMDNAHFSEVHLPGPEPKDADAIAHYLGCPVHFGAPRNKTVLSNVLLETPLPRANRQVVRLYDDMLSSLVTEKSPIIRACRLYLYEEMDKSPPTLARTSQALGMTERTLRRRIREEGKTFRAVIEGLRKQLCGLYLAENKRSIEEIAQLLGYSETSAFTRAHMRWYGVPPSRARRPVLM
jgi:AraC-like DNA-binding protein